LGLSIGAKRWSTVPHTAVCTAIGTVKGTARGTVAAAGVSALVEKEKEEK
jgi:hypothetical protein